MNYKIDHCDPFDGEYNNFWMKLEHCGRYLFAVDVLKKEGVRTVLDLACAEGYGTDIIASNGFSAMGGDVQRAYIDSAERQYKSARYFCVDLDNEIPKDINGVDAVVCFETIEHLKKPFAFLNRLKTLVRKGGVLVLSFPNKIYERVDENGKNKDPFHLHIFEHDEIRQQLENRGFDVVDVYGQAICNDMYKREHDCIEAGYMTQDEADALHKYDRDSILGMSRIVGYPTQSNVERSYSYIFVCKNTCF